jgi:predicted HicB family RNase H-like nuclease
MNKKKDKNLEYYMSLNYPATVELYEEYGEIRFGLQVPDLSGVWAEGKTIEEAYADLIDTKRLWFATCLEKGIDIPEPVSEKDYSGKFILRLNPKLHRDLREMAQRSKISLNQYIRILLEKQISNLDLLAEIGQLGQLISKQSQTIEKLRKEVSSFEQRINSLEEKFSSTLDFEPKIYHTTTKGYPRGVAVIGTHVTAGVVYAQSNLVNFVGGQVIGRIKEADGEENLSIEK